jgi:hypothetical protein
MNRALSLRLSGRVALLGLWVVLCLAGLLTSAQAQNPVGGLDQVLVRPPTVALQVRLTPLQIQRMREVPVSSRLNGLASLKFSFGEFLLLDRGTVGGAGSQQGGIVVGTPSDEGHASTDPVNLDWNDFTNCQYLMTGVRDQGSRGTCHAQAATGLMEALLKKRSYTSGEAVSVGGETRRIREDIDLSVQWLQYRAKKRAHGGDNSTCGDGGDPAYDLETVQTYGHVPEVFWRYNPQHWQSDPAHDEPGNNDGPWNWKLVAQTADGNEPRAAQEAIARRSSDPQRLEDFKISNIINAHHHEDGVNYIKGRINAGVPVAVSVPWPTWRMIANGCILYVPDAVKDRSEDWCWNDKENSGGKMVSKWFRGGHCLVICGYGKPGTPAEGLYLFKNSWSRWWGTNGYGYFTEAFLKKFLWQTVFCDLNSH